MKKKAAAILITAMALNLVACSSSNTSNTTTAGQDTAAAEGQNTPTESDAEVQPASDITSDAVAASAQIPSSYIVQSGDSLALICRRFYGNLDKMDEICELNSISNPNRLTPGQKILLPN